MTISYVYTGDPMTGTANDDFFIAYKGSTGTDNNTINAGGGDDWVVADSSDTWIPNASYLNCSIADAFNLETLAEGVETDEQLAKLQELGCNAWQGFLLSGAISANDLTDFCRMMHLPQNCAAGQLRGK